MILIFSDLDATLLDHNSYSFAEALPALQLIRQRNIPLILSSSKTYEEMIVIKKELNNNDPFIYENGSGVCFDNEKINLGVSNIIIKKLLHDLKKQFTFTSFSELGLDGVQKITGLDNEACQRACQREYTEPIVWNDDEERKTIFNQILSDHKLISAQGGRFLTISGHQNKGDALLWIKNKYENKGQDKIITIGLGDSENDIKMLERVDRAVIVRHPEKPPPQINGHASLLTTDEIGPRGWNKAILNILDTL